MSRRSSNFRATQENRLKNGRGQGIGKDYTPYIQAHDNKVASEGWITRHLGWKTGRIHHTLSEHEKNYLYYLEWLDFVIDIREQYPLSLSKTEEIANRIGIKHPHLDGVPVVMTTDFLLTLETPQGKIDVVRTVKPVSKLSKRTLELFEIERIYFKELGIDWCIILDNKLPKTLINNVRWMCEAKYLETRPGIDEELVNLVSPHLFNRLDSDSGVSSISKLCLQGDKDFGLEAGSCMFILKHHLVMKKWMTNMNLPINDSKPMIVTKVGIQNSIHSDIG